MNINKASWHYIFLDKYGLAHDVPCDLCTYVRHLIFLPMLYIAIGVCVGLVILSLIFTPIAAIHLWITSDVNILEFLLDSRGLIGFGLIAWAAIILSGMAIGAHKLICMYLQYRRELPPTHSEPNIFLEWFRAAKAKVCPILKFNND